MYPGAIFESAAMAQRRHFRRQWQRTVIIKRCVLINVASNTLPIGRASKKRPTRQPLVRSKLSWKCLHSVAVVEPSFLPLLFSLSPSLFPSLSNNKYIYISLSLAPIRPSPRTCLFVSFPLVLVPARLSVCYPSLEAQRGTTIGDRDLC